MTRWEGLTQALDEGTAVCVSDGGFHHSGYLSRVLLRGDGSLHLTFTDRTVIHVPKELL